MRVLCVVPRFPPANSADAHRVRLLLPHLVALGHHVEVLAVDARDLGMPLDEWLLARLPPNTPVHRVRVRKSGLWPLRGLEYRAWAPLGRAGDKLLSGGGFDLVFFSTTDFLLHTLGPRWRRHWGVPFCMDFQDPWVNDYYRQHPEVKPPGGRLKYGLKSHLDRVVERYVVRQSAGWMAVSQAYLQDLARRYGPIATDKPQLVAGFPGEPGEFEGLMRSPNPGPPCWRYIGRGGADMGTAARGFFRAWRQAIDQGLLAEPAVRFEAIGTSYAGGGAPTLAPIAVAEGVGGRVSERPDRIGYRAMLEMLVGSDALVVFGSDDPAYTASKLYPYLLCGRPVLVILHADSPAVRLIRTVGGAVLVTFDGTTTTDTLASGILGSWFRSAQAPCAPALDRPAFEPFTAHHQAARVAQWWQDILAQATAHGN